MDLKKLNTRDAAEDGRFLHLRHPAMGHLLYTPEDENVDENGRWNKSGEEPEKIGVIVRGQESRSAKKVVEETRKRRMMMEPHEWDSDKDTLDYLCSLVVEFVNLSINGKELSKAKDDKKLFFAQSESFEDQVTEFAKEKAHFFGEAATG